MSREVRRVAKDWKHPSEGRYADGKPRYEPLHDRSYTEAAAEFMKLSCEATAALAPRRKKATR